jgi:hypothetical protein
MECKEPTTKRAKLFPSSPELDGDTLTNLSSALAPGSRAPVSSLAVVDIMMSVSCNWLIERLEAAKPPNQHSSGLKWLVDVHLGGGGDLDISECLKWQSYEKIQLAQVDLAHVRACHGDSAKTRHATVHVMRNLFMCQENLSTCDGFDETDEMIACRKYGSWDEVESCRNILVSSQGVWVERRRQALARMLTVDSVLERVLLSQ